MGVFVKLFFNKKRVRTLGVRTLNIDVKKDLHPTLSRKRARGKTQFSLATASEAEPTMPASLPRAARTTLTTAAGTV